MSSRSSTSTPPIFCSRIFDLQIRSNEMKMSSQFRHMYVCFRMRLDTLSKILLYWNNHSKSDQNPRISYCYCRLKPWIEHHPRAHSHEVLPRQLENRVLPGKTSRVTAPRCHWKTNVAIFLPIPPFSTHFKSPSIIMWLAQWLFWGWFCVQASAGVNKL